MLQERCPTAQPGRTRALPLVGGFSGASFAALDYDLRESEKVGVIVTEVDPNSPFAERGIKKGDIILEMAGKSVRSPADVANAIDSVRKGNKLTSEAS